MKKLLKRQVILDVSAALLNKQGASGFDLGIVAKSVNITKNGLYYYFADRKELVFHCYVQTCETINEHLVFAKAQCNDPIGQLVIFVNRVLSPEFKERAVMTDIALLAESEQDIVRELFLEIVSSIETVFEAGIEAGVFRRFDTISAAYSLLGMVSWSQLWNKWTQSNRNKQKAFASEVSRSVVELMLYGLTTDVSASFNFSEDVTKIQLRPFNLLDKKQAAIEKSNQVAQMASYLFNRHGIAGLSLENLCKYAGITKGTIYHYFRDKTDLVNRCYQLAFDHYELYIDTADKLGKNSYEKLLIVLHLNIQAQSSARPPLMLQPGLQELSPQFVKRASKGSNRLKLMCQLGIERGECREGSDINFEISAGVVFWISKWTPEPSITQGMRFADSMCDIFLHGIMADQSAYP